MSTLQRLLPIGQPEEMVRSNASSTPGHHGYAMNEGIHILHIRTFGINQPEKQTA
jgi:hypothetical protein